MEEKESWVVVHFDLDRPRRERFTPSYYVTTGEILRCPQCKTVRFNSTGWLPVDRSIISAGALGVKEINNVVIIASLTATPRHAYQLLETYRTSFSGSCATYRGWAGLHLEQVLMPVKASELIRKITGAKRWYGGGKLPDGMQPIAVTDLFAYTSGNDVLWVSLERNNEVTFKTKYHSSCYVEAHKIDSYVSLAEDAIQQGALKIAPVDKEIGEELPVWTEGSFFGHKLAESDKIMRGFQLNSVQYVRMAIDHETQIIATDHEMVILPQGRYIATHPVPAKDKHID